MVILLFVALAGLVLLAVLAVAFIGPLPAPRQRDPSLTLYGPRATWRHRA
jgi:hypothetical protein